LLHTADEETERQRDATGCLAIRPSIAENEKCRVNLRCSRIRSCFRPTAERRWNGRFCDPSATHRRPSSCRSSWPQVGPVRAPHASPRHIQGHTRPAPGPPHTQPVPLRTYLSATCALPGRHPACRSAPGTSRSERVCTRPRSPRSTSCGAAAGKWITHPPTRCPNGHTLGPGEVLVGHQACLGHELRSRRLPGCQFIEKGAKRDSSSSGRGGNGCRCCRCGPPVTVADEPYPNCKSGSRLTRT
jgi:hypothetical protein